MPTASKAAIMRLNKEFKSLVKDPEPLFRLVPLEENILEWHFCLLPPDDTVYAGGRYHGKLVLPKDYPFRPPSVMMITPSGRFESNKRLCLSMSDYHPETWSSSWQCRTVVLGLLSFMLENEITAGSITSTDAEKRRLAKESHAFNSKDPLFRRLWPDLCAEGGSSSGGGGGAGSTKDSNGASAAEGAPQAGGQGVGDDEGGRVGAKGVLEGLDAAQYNGRRVVAEGWDAAAGRYQVRLADDGQLIRVKPANVQWSS